MSFTDIVKFMKEHKWQVSLGLIGFIAAILMLTIGFFRTLLIIIFTCIGLLFGYLVDKVGFRGAWTVIKRFFDRRL